MANLTSHDTNERHGTSVTVAPETDYFSVELHECRRKSPPIEISYLKARNVSDCHYSFPVLQWGMAHSRYPNRRYRSHWAKGLTSSPSSTLLV